MARTPQSPQRLTGRLLTLLVLVTVFGAACSAAPTWTPVDSAQAASGPAAETATAEADEPDVPVVATLVDEAPEELAFAAEAAEPGVAPPSAEFCSASANIWTHSAALNLLGGDASAEMTRIALANVAEWIERSTLFDEPNGPDHNDMFEAFTELQTVVGTDFDYRWTALQASSDYANSDAAQTYEAARSDLVPFLGDQCETVSMADLRADAKARADELLTEFGTAPSTVGESDSLPGHSIFTHSSGRLIASFPTAWSYEERQGSPIVDLVASPDIDRFLDGEAIDGIRLQLIEAASVEEFRAQLDNTMTGTTCERTNDLSDSGAVRTNITQTFACADHGASIMGQYNEGRGLGLIIEASFDRVDASRADLIRLASIANSALWS